MHCSGIDLRALHPQGLPPGSWQEALGPHGDHNLVSRLAQGVCQRPSPTHYRSRRDPCRSASATKELLRKRRRLIPSRCLVFLVVLCCFWFFCFCLCVVCCFCGCCFFGVCWCFF